jgi:hypothetical protein
MLPESGDERRIDFANEIRYVPQSSTSHFET